MDIIINQLNAGILPSQLNFTVQDNTIDIQKLQYNAFYRSYEFYESKFSNGYQGIPGFDKVIELCAQNNQDNSPLKELESIKNKQNNNKE